MIKQLKLTDNFRSYLDQRKGDVIMQGNPDGMLIVMTTGESFFDMSGYYEAIVRGNRSVNAHINHKRAVVRCLKGYTPDEVETLTESDLDGILRDYANAHKRNANREKQGA